jgi:flagellar hook protein FlgE
MAGELSTIQSLKAVDAWIDVINANINGGVRTGFKSSRLKFSGSNVDIQRAGTSTSLPLQFPEAGLQTANTVVDFSQGAITASTENTHLALQGEGFFMIASPDLVNTDGTMKAMTSSGKVYLTRDGEFRTNQNGMLVNAAGYYLLAVCHNTTDNSLSYPAFTGAGGLVRAVYNDVDNPGTVAAGNPGNMAVTLSTWLTGTGANFMEANGAAHAGFAPWQMCSFVTVAMGKQSLRYTALGSTIYDFSFQTTGAYPALGHSGAEFAVRAGSTADATILSKSLEASNASMTQSVPELSLAQKLFSALTKVLQTKQTNLDGVLNLIR